MCFSFFYNSYAINKKKTFHYNLQEKEKKLHWALSKKENENKNIVKNEGKLILNVIFEKHEKDAVCRWHWHGELNAILQDLIAFWSFSKASRKGTKEQD